MLLEELGIKKKSNTRPRHVKSERMRRFIITYSEARARKDIKDRERLITKAKKLVNAPSMLKAEYKRGERSIVTVEIEKGLCLS